MAPNYHVTESGRFGGSGAWAHGCSAAISDRREPLISSSRRGKLPLGALATRRGATTKPVSVTLPEPLANAFRLLADRGLIDSVSLATTRALEEALQAVIVGMRLDAIYAEDPDARPSEEEIAELAARAGVTLP